MKRLFLLLLILCTISRLSAQEQPGFPYKNAFRFQVTGLFNHTYNLSYERSFGKHSTLNFSTGVYNYERTVGENKEKTSGPLIEIQSRNYFFEKQNDKNEKIWNRMFVGPFVFYHNYNETSESISDYSDYTFSSYGGGVILGYNFTYKMLSFEFYAAGALKMITEEDNVFSSQWYNGKFWEPGWQGPTAKAGVNVGISF